MFSKKLDYGEAGDNVGILLYGIQPTAVRRGQVLAIPHTIKTHTVFSACIYLFTKSEGGREKPLFNSDRVRVYIRTTEVLGIVSLSEGMEMILPGDTSEAEITLITPMPIEENLRFAIRESGRVIGFGVVTTIID